VEDGNVIIQILSIVLGLCFFIVPVWAYRQGLKDGLNIKQDKPIEPLPRLTTPFQKAQTDVATDKMMEGLHNLMSYDGNPQKPKEDK
jgi:hypothetical protein